MSFIYKLSITVIFGLIVPAFHFPELYTCPPCGQECDTLEFTSSGKCHYCGMELEVRPETGKIKLEEGSGKFIISDDRDSTKTIQVYYHMPESYNENSEIVMVIPGAGRNADDYRDAWIQISEKYDVLVLSPSFSERDYNFEAYHLGGLIHSSNLMDNVEYIDGTNKAKLNEQNYRYKISNSPDQWIYPQFDRIFELVKNELKSNRETYDLFGHSAGGHILHRMGLFYSSEKVGRILASNASFYTLPSMHFNYPFGIGNLSDTSINLEAAFRNKLIVFLGEEDNADETRGTFLISKSADRQGAHRLERGRFFYQFSEKIASDSKLEFNWQIVTVPGIGHNYRKMSDAASQYLYNRSNTKQ
ncbi:hypothetical protein AB2B38_003295 [Balneola sp. MJW-20]|uniref:hypothetical protein n=1 Tax=Gracilimonas aurantiaca TaxID=3234185 RepID=UPI00346663E5